MRQKKPVEVLDLDDIQEIIYACYKNIGCENIDIDLYIDEDVSMSGVVQYQRIKCNIWYDENIDE